MLNLLYMIINRTAIYGLHKIDVPLSQIVNTFICPFVFELLNMHTPHLAAEQGVLQHANMVVMEMGQKIVIHMSLKSLLSRLCTSDHDSVFHKPF